MNIREQINNKINQIHQRNSEHNSLMLKEFGASCKYASKCLPTDYQTMFNEAITQILEENLGKNYTDYRGESTTKRDCFTTSP